jgi:hypothetical protein
MSKNITTCLLRTLPLLSLWLIVSAASSAQTACPAILSTVNQACNYSGNIDLTIEQAGGVLNDDPQSAGYGIRIGSSLSAMLENNGEITVIRPVGAGAGIGVEFASITATGNIINNGQVTVSENDGIDSVIGFKGADINGSIENFGDISVTANNNLATALGIVVANLNNGGQILNQGDINTTTGAGGLAGSALGIDIANIALGAGVTNTGKLISTATASNQAEAEGLRVDTLNGSIDNSGVINVTASTSNSSGSVSTQGTAFGIVVNKIEGTGTITNSGTITASDLSALMGISNQDVAGIQIGRVSSDNVTIRNSGTITAEASSDGIMAYALDINSDFPGQSTATIVNSSSGLLDGDLRIVGDISLENSGTIIGGGTIGGDYNITATGLHLVNAKSTTSYDQLSVAGGVSIAANGAVGVNVDTDTQAYVIGGQTYQDVISAGTLSVVGPLASDTGSIIWQAVAVDDASNNIDVTVGLVTQADIAPGQVVNEGNQFALRVPDTGGLEPVTINNAGIIEGDVNLGDSVLNMQGQSSAVNGRISGVTGSSININGLFTSGGSIGVDRITINNGGNFTPLHTITSAVQNDGVFTIAAGNRAQISGSYTQNANGVLAIGANSSADYGQLVVTGNADFSAGKQLTVNVGGNQSFAANTVLADVVSAGSITAGDIAINDNSQFLDFDAVIDGATIDVVTSTGSSAVDIINVASVTSKNNVAGAVGVATVIDQLIVKGVDGQLGQLITTLDAIDDVERLGESIAQLMPRAYVTEQVIGELVNSVQQRVLTIRAANSVRQTDGSSPTGQDWWLKAFGTRGEQDEIDGVNGYDIDSYNLSIGYDKKVNDSIVMGLAFNYTEADIDSDEINASRLSIEGYQLSAYLSYALDEATFVDAIVMLGANDNDSRRKIAIGEIDGIGSGDFDSRYGRLYAAVGRDHLLNQQFTLTPIVSLLYTYIEEDSYNETGLGDIGLAVNKRDAEFAVAELAVAGNYALNAHHHFSATAGFGYELLSTDTTIDASFIGDSTVFQTNGAERAPEEYTIGLGYKFIADDQLTVNVNYDYEAAQGYKNQMLSATARYLW